ncbi:hypothetical protein [Pirellula sp. SH-Sr6A]|uniref:hypothetical protein n=1 Tax=Pirellula sp. SH-Sr6A TaxID=1632865 RepID=UPI0011BA67AA|nr:hypothetical protein [Pirellula sp. SH-Sr6A]
MLASSKYSLLLLLTFWVAGRAEAQSTTLTAKQIRTAMQSERNKITDGILTAVGSYSQAEGRGPVRKTDIRWSYEFDFPNGKFLFDRSETCFATSDTRSGERDELRIFFCEDPVTRYTYHDFIIPTAALFIHPRIAPEKELSSHFKRFDIRGVGFCNSSNIYSRSHDGDEFFFEPLGVNVMDDIRVDEESGDILKLSYKRDVPQRANLPKIPMDMKLWVDKSRGFTPIRVTSVRGGEIELDCRTDWKQIGGVWVPSKLSGTFRSRFLPEGKEPKEENIEYRTEDFQLEIKWVLLNGPSELIMYDFKEFDLPNGTAVYKDGKSIYFYLNQPK